MKKAIHLLAVFLFVAESGVSQSTDWPSFGNDPGNSKYSPLDQINAENFERVAVAWKWESIDTQKKDLPSNVRPGPFKPVPLVIDGRMYVSTAIGQIAAIDARSGETLWHYDPQSWEAGRPANLGFQHRGVAFWQKGDKQRILMPTHDRRLISIDAATGKPDPDFGNSGAIGMTKDLGRKVVESRTTHSSPPAICGDTVIVGSIVGDGVTHKEGPPGFVRAYNVSTGDLAWVFHTIPQAGEEGNETWENDSWKYTGNTNVWSMITVDEELGLAYLPIGTPTNDLYGGHRLGDNLFAESLVAVDCKTGKKRWHHQLVHHGIWDFDIPTAPSLIDVVKDGQLIKAIVQPTKQAFAFVFDRSTGEPLWPIEERPVPASDVPGERASETQPFPTRPLAYDRQGITEADLIDFTPELRKAALEITKDYDLVPFFSPPRVSGTRKPSIQLPSEGGGTNWPGVAVDPEAGMVFVPSHTRPASVTLIKPDAARSNLNFVPDNWYSTVGGPEGLPLVKPPYGRITAIDLSTGDHEWVSAHGEGPRNHKAIQHLGLGRLGAAHHEVAVLATKTLLFATQRAEYTAGFDPDDPKPDRAAEISVYDKKTGEYLGGIELPDTANSILITYQLDGRQYLAVSVGGGRYMMGGGGTTPYMVALALNE